jgi:heat shock protein HslJ
MVGTQPLAPASRLLHVSRALLLLADGDVAGSTPGDPARLVLAADGTLSGATGCRPPSGRWSVDPDTLAVTELTADGDCPADLERQDAHVTAVLGAGARAVVAEDRLTLTGTDGRGLVYRAEGRELTPTRWCPAACWSRRGSPGSPRAPRW